MIGIGLLGLSILIFWSLLLTSADRVNIILMKRKKDKNNSFKIFK